LAAPPSSRSCSALAQIRRSSTSLTRCCSGRRAGCERRPARDRRCAVPDRRRDAAHLSVSRSRRAVLVADHHESLLSGAAPAGSRAQLAAVGPADLPRLEQAAIDGGVLLFTLAAVVVTSLIALIPAWRASGRDSADALRAGTLRATLSSTRVSRMLVAGQFALAVVLLVGAGLLIRTAWALAAVDVGFRADHAVTMNVALPARMPAPLRLAFSERLLAAQVRAWRRGRRRHQRVIRERRAADSRLRRRRRTSRAAPRSLDRADVDRSQRRFFRAVGARVVRGRVFTDRDTAASPLVAVVDQSLAQRYWRGEDPIGRRFKRQDARRAGDEWLTVIGVVEDMRREGRDRASTPHVFEWQQQTQSTAADIVVRTRRIRWRRSPASEPGARGGADGDHLVCRHAREPAA
jgi:hypothetical protein